MTHENWICLRHSEVIATRSTRVLLAGLDEVDRERVFRRGWIEKDGRRFERPGRRSGSRRLHMISAAPIDLGAA